MLNSEVWVHFSFVIVPVEYFKSLVDESNKMNVWIMFGDRVVSFRNFVTPNETPYGTFAVVLREVT
jgi:hypothetical protein